MAHCQFLVRKEFAFILQSSSFIIIKNCNRYSIKKPEKSVRINDTMRRQGLQHSQTP